MSKTLLRNQPFTYEPTGEENGLAVLLRAAARDGDDSAVRELQTIVPRLSGKSDGRVRARDGRASNGPWPSTFAVRTVRALVKSWLAEVLRQAVEAFTDDIVKQLERVPRKRRARR